MVVSTRHLAAWAIRMAYLLSESQPALSHGYMALPPAVYKDPSTMTSYVYRMDGRVVFPGLKWDDSPRRNSDQLAKKIYEGQFPELRSFSRPYVSDCPFNDMSAPIDVTNLNVFQWQNDQERKGFVPSHEGPCEIWIDNAKIFNDTNCATRYQEYPARIPIDYSICRGTCRFEFYWMAMQEPLWQLYKACANIYTKVASTSSPPKLICREP